MKLADASIGRKEWVQRYVRLLLSIGAFLLICNLQRRKIIFLLQNAKTYPIQVVIKIQSISQSQEAATVGEGLLLGPHHHWYCWWSLCHNHCHCQYFQQQFSSSLLSYGYGRHGKHHSKWRTLMFGMLIVTMFLFKLQINI